MSLWKGLKKVAFSAIGKPYFDFEVSLDGEELTVKYDYNAAFIRYLDKNGYANKGETSEQKVFAYIGDTWSAVAGADDEEPYEEILPV
jgi:hypothetical protein